MQPHSRGGGERRENNHAQPIKLKAENKLESVSCFPKTVHEWSLGSPLV